jgi:excisionase family DNA binding protein
MTAPANIALLSIEQVAEILKLHPRTIRNYVRRGTLKATRIGKQYRIAQADLEAFSGRPVTRQEDALRSRGGRIEVASVISLEGVTPELASRIANMMTATADILRTIEAPVAVSTHYEAPRERMRVLLAADLTSTRDFLSLIGASLEKP